jgi:hypothetical protein
MCSAAEAPVVQEQLQQAQQQLEAMEQEPIQEQEQPAASPPAEAAAAPKEAAPSPEKAPKEAPRLQRRARKRNAAVAAAIEAEEWRSDADEENSEEEAGGRLPWSRVPSPEPSKDQVTMSPTQFL